MKHFLILLIIMGSQSALPEVCRATQFKLHGKYFLGGLFDVHTTNSSILHNRPEAVVCSRESLSFASYQRFQVMRFAVEEINNSTLLLPDVTLGYDIFDYCSYVLNFPEILNLVSINDSIHVMEDDDKHSPMIGVVGAFTSSATLTAAPLFMTNLIPMISYGSATSDLSEKGKYPSFLRTVPSNREMMKLVILILKQFNWFWVAFMRSDDDYSKDALELFQAEIKDTDICLAYVEELHQQSDYSKTIQSIEETNVHVILVFTQQIYAEALVQSAIKCNIWRKKVWIAGDSWSLNTELPKENGIERIGTVIGVSSTVVQIPGFHDFVREEQRKRRTCEQQSSGQSLCNQDCEVCNGVSAEEVIVQNPSYSFAVYSAVYAMAHALHRVLQCDSEGCYDNVTVCPFMVLRELKKINFTLLNRNIQFDANGDPLSASYAVVYWNLSGHSEIVGSYETHPVVQFSIDSTKIDWYTNRSVPISRCAKECSEGYIRNQDGVHKCCFHCEICPSGTYVNSTVEYACNHCKTTEWSKAGSNHCEERSVEYILFTDHLTILLMLCTIFMLAVTLAIAILFARKYDTPVVRSAGGPMCFLMLACLNVCGISVFFFFGVPTHLNCTLRYLLFTWLYTPCLACFVVRAFQIVCIFKMASKFPNIHRWWVKHNGQWLVIAVSFGFQTLCLSIGFIISPPKPSNDTTTFDSQIILNCYVGGIGLQIAYQFLPVVLCILCFVFSYMGKDLPKNYNEAKAITFCLLLLILTWVSFFTVAMLYRGKYVPTFNAMSVLSSSYAIILWYFLPKCYIIVFQPEKNTPQHFQGIIQSYTQTISKE